MDRAEQTFCPTFHPTKKEFSQPFCEYVQRVCKENPDIAMFKVIPPKSWTARRAKMPDFDEMRIETPIRQHVFGTGGVFRSILEEQKSLSVADFKRIAHNLHKTPPKGARKDDLLERAFWSSVTANPPLYGADNPTSLFDQALDYGWNLNNLGDLLKKHNVESIPGVTTPMVYFGMWKSFFSWHVEDVDLYSINYLHFGEPKVWYCVSPKDRPKFEAMAKNLFPELHNICQAFLRHKDILLSPKKLRSHQIQYVQAKQEAGEFIVLNAGAYHSGFNLGFNCAEAVNFATEDWLATGKEATQCTCSALPDHVTLDMKIFSRGTRVSQRLKAALEKGRGGASSSSKSESESEDTSSDDDVEEASCSDTEEEPRPAKRSRVPSRSAVRTKPATQQSGRKTKQKSRSLNELSKASPQRTEAQKKPSQAIMSKGQAQKSALKSLSAVAKQVAIKQSPGHKQQNKQQRQQRKGSPPARDLQHQGRSHQQGRPGSPAYASSALAKLEAARGRGSKRLAGQPPELPTKPKRRRESKGPGESTQAADTSPRAGKPSSVSQAFNWMRSLVGGNTPAKASKDQPAEAPVEVNDQGKEDMGVYAIVKEDAASGQRLFYLVQKLKKKARQRHHVVVRCMEEGVDKVYRPADKTWEETEDALLPVRLQTCSSEGQKGKSKTQRFKLLTSQNMMLGSARAI